jgi:hypothetical protein
VRLRSTSDGKTYFCRTFGFSTMGVATGAALQSARFTVPHLPCGDYDLCVIANGISSHCVSFCHERPSRACGCLGGHEAPRTCCCSEPRGCGRECPREIPDPEIGALRDQVKRLENGMNRLVAVVKGEAGAAQPKETKDQEEQEEKEKSDTKNKKG